jgi:adenosylcobinamide kinase/adenosylcobinamide-phosphate guanylyltransferase
MAHLTLIVGGVRSGKSRLAEELAAACPPVTYVATALAGDPEMADRIARHQQRRSPDWRTVEEPWNVVTAVARHLGDGCVVLECLTLWLTNLMVGLPQHPAREDADILAEVDALICTAGRAGSVSDRSGRLIVVSNEVGCGIMPANELGRRFADVLGEANQRLASAAEEVFACWAGIPHKLK